MKQKISSCEVKFHPHSFGDLTIRLFQWNGQIYRGISSKGVTFFSQLFQNGLIQKLTEQGLLIESDLTPLEVDEYQLVVRHRYIPFTSYPNEWCAAMLKNAALTLINLAIELAEHGFTLADGHPWNLLFDIDSGRPVFVDLGSIIPIDDSIWHVYDEFCIFCLYPLVLMSYEQPQIARLLMCEDQGVQNSTLLLLTQGKALSKVKPNSSLVRYLELVWRQKVPEPYRQQLKKSLNSILSQIHRKSSDIKPNSDSLGNLRQNSHLAFLKNIRRQVESIALPFVKTELSEQYGKPNLSLPNQENWTVKQQTLHKILTDIKPNSVLDLGSNTGWYSKLAALLGSKVVAFDIDENCVTQLYYDACNENLPILPLIMDFTKPTPARGLSNHWAIAATERFQCDMVLALGLMHEIVLKRRLNFDQVVEGLTLFSKRWVVVEFIPREDQDVSQLWSERVSWYTLENFIDALRKGFDSISILSSDPESRVLLLCEK
jgi:hypothetical protein